MKLSSKQILWIVAVVIVIFIIIGIWFYEKGKKTTTIAAIPVDDPSGNNAYGVTASMVSSISDALYNDLNGWDLFGDHDTTPYKNWDSLSDTDFVNVYNDFNTKHQADGKGTLTQRVNSADFLFADVANSIRARLGRLNLP